MDAYALFLDGGAVTTKHELLRGRRELGQAGNGQILVVEVGVIAQTLVGLESRAVLAWRAMLRRRGRSAAPRISGYLTILTTGRIHGFALSSL